MSVSVVPGKTVLVALTGGTLQWSKNCNMGVDLDRRKIEGLANQ
jgi:hypothetical protein